MEDAAFGFDCGSRGSLYRFSFVSACMFCIEGEFVDGLLRESYRDPRRPVPQQ